MLRWWNIIQSRHYLLHKDGTHILSLRFFLRKSILLVINPQPNVAGRVTYLNKYPPWLHNPGFSTGHNNRNMRHVFFLPVFFSTRTCVETWKGMLYKRNVKHVELLTDNLSYEAANRKVDAIGNVDGKLEVLTDWLYFFLHQTCISTKPCAKTSRQWSQVG